MRKTFVVMTGRHKGKTLALTNQCTVIGRDPESDIRINSTEVSRRHCELYLHQTHILVKDLGSRNGTFLNGDAIFADVEMHPGDSLHVGPMIFELAGKKKRVASSQPKKQSASDDDVIDWLADNGPISDSDTTIVTNEQAEKMASEESAPLVPRVPSVTMQPLEPGTPAAEAADVIRDFWLNKNN